jgi:uncharacterized RDD family membrane protein YckC
MPSDQPQIDSAISIRTAENIAFTYRTAGPFRRGVAFGIDFAIRVFVIIACVILLLVFGLLSNGALFGVGVSLLTLVYFVSDVFYGALFETFMNGQTPGKWILGIRVVTREGQPISGMQAVLRNLFRWVDMAPPVWVWMPGAQQYVPFNITCMLGLICMSFDPRFRRLGDLVGGTMVVVNERNWLIGMAKLDDPRAMKLAAYIPADFEVTRTMGQALAGYVERRRFFSEARRREIARYLGAPLVRLFGFPADTSHDLLLCALYYRKFVADAGQEGKDSSSMLEGTPIAAPYYPSPQSYPQPQPMQPPYQQPGVPNPFINAQTSPQVPQPYPHGPQPVAWQPPNPDAQSGASTFLPPR